jgi:hypothetical protein
MCPVDLTPLRETLVATARWNVYRGLRQRGETNHPTTVVFTPCKIYTISQSLSPRKTATMPSNEVSNGFHAQQPANGPAPPVLEGEVPYLSTEPSPDQSWAITLKDKVIAITGANRGIGLGIAQVCLENSAKVVYSLDLMEPGEDFAILSKKHPNLKYVQTDVTNDESIEKSLDSIIEAEGRLDGMVANAGMVSSCRIT